MAHEREPLLIAHLYPDLLNTYGDRANVLALVQRAAWRGIPTRTLTATVDDPFPREAEIVCIGGGEDGSQVVVSADLVRHRDTLQELVAEGLPLLAVCGGYQLLGTEYVTGSGRSIRGIGLVEARTVWESRRSVGNVTLCCNALPIGTIVGFENHGGRTYLSPGAQPLGRVLHGKGNNGRDRSEGIIQNHCIGTYLHGLLPKNPQLADWLLLVALRRRDGPQVTLQTLDDRLEWAAHRAAMRA